VALIKGSKERGFFEAEHAQSGWDHEVAGGRLCGEDKSPKV